MSNQTETIFCGNGREVTFQDGGSIVNFSVALAKVKEHIYEFNGEKYVNLTICANRDGENEYGKTHYVKVNTFKPEEGKKTSKAKAPATADDDSLPF